MQDSSPSFHSPSLPTLPSSFTFQIDRETLNEVVAMAERFAPVPRGDYSVALQFTPGSQRWIMEEHNCVATLTASGAPGPRDGAVVLPLHFLHNLSILFSDAGSFPIQIDSLKKTAQFEYGNESLSTTLPLQDFDNSRSEFVASQQVVVSPHALVRLGSVLRSCPIDFGENEEGLPMPFTVLNITHSSLTATRNWAAFGGASTSMTIEAQGDFEGTVSYFPDPMNREMLFNEVEEDGFVTISFSTETPNIAMMTGGNWALRFDLGHEHVFHYRRLIEGQLVGDGMNVEIDERIGWNPTVQVRVDERLVDVDIIPGLTVLDATLRASTVVLVDAPWTLEMASEVNAWNDQWASVKLVYQDSSLYAVCDFPVSSIESVSGLVRDLAAKTALVDQVIGVFI